MVATSDLEIVSGEKVKREDRESGNERSICHVVQCARWMFKRTS